MAPEKDMCSPKIFKSVSVDDWTVELAIIASNDAFQKIHWCLLYYRKDILTRCIHTTAG